MEKTIGYKIVVWNGSQNQSGMVPKISLFYSIWDATPGNNLVAWFHFHQSQSMKFCRARGPMKCGHLAIILSKWNERIFFWFETVILWIWTSSTNVEMQCMLNYVYKNIIKLLYNVWTHLGKQAMTLRSRLKKNKYFTCIIFKAFTQKHTDLTSQNYTCLAYIKPLSTHLCFLLGKSSDIESKIIVPAIIAFIL